MYRLKDIDKPSGWMVKVTVSRGDFISDVRQYFYTFEADKEKAVALVPVTNGEKVEAIRTLDAQEMAALGMKPGDVKHYA
jgi:hypothetical protein